MGRVASRQNRTLEQNAALRAAFCYTGLIMSWAARRRFFILLIVGAVGAAILAIIAIATFYKAPSCTDGIQNQGETGIDCGGPCPYLCTAQEQPPTVLFTQALPNGAGRTDIIALVENKNADAAAQNVPYHLMLYGAGQVLLGDLQGTLDLPPGATIPLYIPNVASGKQTVTSAFLNIAASAPNWFRMTSDPRIVPTVSNTALGGSATAPRIEATLTNPSVTMLTNVRAVVLVRGAGGNVIAASATIVPSIAPQGQATVLFTWNGAFSGVPLSIEVIPIVPLPSS